MEKINSRKKRVVSKEITAKWFKNLNLIKNEINSNQHGGLQFLVSKYKIHTYWGTFLYKNNIVYRDELGFLKWNEKIPVTVMLIDSFRLYLQDTNLKLKSKKIQELNNIKQKEMQTPLPPSPPIVKKRGSYKKTTKQTIAVKEQKTQIASNDKIKEVGLIRRFWKWLY